MRASHNRLTDEWADELDYRICRLCGFPFEPNKHNQLYCEDCRVSRKQEIYNRNKKIRNDKKAKQKYLDKTLNEITADLKEYNDVHDTCITYGKYVAMLENDELKD